MEADGTPEAVDAELSASSRLHGSDPRWCEIGWHHDHVLSASTIEAAFERLRWLYPVDHLRPIELGGSDLIATLRAMGPQGPCFDPALQLGLDLLATRLSETPATHLVAQLRNEDQFVGARHELRVWATLARTQLRFEHESVRTSGTLDFHLPDLGIDLDAKVFCGDLTDWQQARLRELHEAVWAVAHKSGIHVHVHVTWSNPPYTRASKANFDSSFPQMLDRVRVAVAQPLRDLTTSSARVVVEVDPFTLRLRPYPNPSAASAVEIPNEDHAAEQVLRNLLKKARAQAKPANTPFAVVIGGVNQVLLGKLRRVVQRYASRKENRDVFLGCLIERPVVCTTAYVVPNLLVPMPAFGAKHVIQEVTDKLNSVRMLEHRLLHHHQSDAACSWLESASG